MTDKELRKLSRDKLLELLLEQTLEVEKMQNEIDMLRAQLDNKNIIINNAGSIAEASLQLNRVFETAQEAADQYLESIKSTVGKQEEICNQLMDECKAKATALEQATQRKCAAMEEETRSKCKKMLESAQGQTDEYWNGVFDKLSAYMQQRNDLELAKPKGANEAEELPKLPKKKLLKKH